MGRSASLASGGSATQSWRPYGTIFGSRTTLASATGSSDLATARMLPLDRIAGSCMGCSDDRPPIRGASSHFAFQLPARCVLLRGAVRPGVLLGIEALAIVDRNS